MLRPQFSLNTMLWLIALLAAFLGGMGVEHRLRVKERERLIEQIEYLERTYVNYSDP